MPLELCSIAKGQRRLKLSAEEQVHALPAACLQRTLRDSLHLCATAMLVPCCPQAGLLYTATAGWHEADWMRKGVQQPHSSTASLKAGCAQSNMADKASQTPQDRCSWVEQSFRDSGLDKDPAAKAWGMTISPQMGQARTLLFAWAAGQAVPGGWELFSHAERVSWGACCPQSRPGLQNAAATKLCFCAG